MHKCVYRLWFVGRFLQWRGVQRFQSSSTTELRLVVRRTVQSASQEGPQRRLPGALAWAMWAPRQEESIIVTTIPFSPQFSFWSCLSSSSSFSFSPHPPPSPLFSPHPHIFMFSISEFADYQLRCCETSPRGMLVSDLGH